MSKKVPRNAFWDHFSDLEDTRSTGRNYTYDLQTVVTLAVIGLCCEQNSFSKISAFLRMQWTWFSAYFPDLKGPPSRSTFQRVFEIINPDVFESCFSHFSQSIHAKCEPKDGADADIIAIDGKRIRNSGSSTHPALHLVSAWASETGLVLGQVATTSSSNEIEAIPRLLDILSIEGALVTIDAIGCQTAIVQRVIEKKADYLITCKANQKTLHRDIKTYFDATETGTLEAHDSFTESDKGHGRLETRTCTVLHDVAWLPQRDRFPSIASLVKVTATRSRKDKTTCRSRYYISSVKKPPAQQMLYATRKHWGIENNHHWVMDVVFDEDNACIRQKTTAHNIAAARRLANNLIKAQVDYKGSPSNARMAATFDLNARHRLMISMT